MTHLSSIVTRTVQLSAVWRAAFEPVTGLLSADALPSSAADLVAYAERWRLAVASVSGAVLAAEATLLSLYETLRTDMLVCDFVLPDALADRVLRFMCAFHAAREALPLLRFCVRQTVALLGVRLPSTDDAPLVQAFGDELLASVAACPAARSQFMKNFEAHVAQLMTPPSAAEDLSFVTLAKEITEFTVKLWRSPSAPNAVAGDAGTAAGSDALQARATDGVVAVTSLDRLNCAVGQKAQFALTLFNAGDANPMPPLAAVVARGEEHGPVLCVYTVVDEHSASPTLASAMHHLMSKVQCDTLRGTVIAIVATMPARLSSAVAFVMRQRLRDRLVPACDVVLELVGPVLDCRSGTMAVCDMTDELGFRIAQLCDARVITDQESCDVVAANAASLALATFEYNRLGMKPAVLRNTLAKPTAVMCAFGSAASNPVPLAFNVFANALALLQMARAHIRRDLEHFPYVLPHVHPVTVADGGVFVAAVPLGAVVHADKTVLGRMTDSFGRDVSELLAPVDGILTALNTKALIMAGTTIATICRWQ
jgi:hypothetical protein